MVDGIPIRVPMLDIHTVGAGGGSLARIDEGGLLRVGPESAGADPGPACYGIGTRPTVTDAHIVLGRVTSFLSGEMPLDKDRAAQAMDTIAGPLQISRVEAAEGILKVANANMERAIRAVSIERGYDPRQFALVAFGGCGGLHACDIAAELQIRTVIAPASAGVLSALGMLLAPHVRDYAAGVLSSNATIEPRFAELESRARRENRKAKLQRFADVRYQGQSYELTIPFTGPKTTAAFHKEHAKTYGYSDASRPIEIVTIRVRATTPVRKPRLNPPRHTTESSKPELRRVHIDGRWRNIAAWSREHVPAKPIPGPALILDYGSTTLVPAHWTAKRVGASIVLERK
jgi:N-methylhydantoinase A